MSCVFSHAFEEMCGPALDHAKKSDRQRRNDPQNDARAREPHPEQSTSWTRQQVSVIDRDAPNLNSLRLERR
jgi:hypothetical protein